MDARLLEKLNSFLAIEKSLRTATSAQQIARITCSDSQQLLKFDSCLFFSGANLKLIAASNVTTIDATSSEAVRWRRQVQKHFAAAKKQRLLQVQFSTAAPKDGDQKAQEAHHLILIPLGRNGEEGCLALLRAKAFSQQEQEIVRELADSVQQALLALRGARRFSLRRLCARRPLILAAVFAGICLIPVRQSVLAPATLAAIEPRIVSARTDGVIREINIPPNAKVQNGQLLFTLEDAEVTAEIDRVQQEIALYRERLRMTRQYNFQQAAAGHKLAQAETDLSIRNLDLSYQQTLLDKTRVKAPATGVAIYTDPSDWIGRRIYAGEKVMEIVQPHARQIQIDLPTADAIPLPKNAQTVFYAESDPLSPIRGQLRYHSLLTAEGENLPASYRLLASIQQDRAQIRINTRGHARIYGTRVPLVYYLLRRPLASARRWVGI
ncbi:HlyD family efflux transporter periplasmic adaptor subunit [Microbulbifer celer]|uniref:HlyD family efflux transporter periplasmic adaptor subunit n=1 Tax=Microbulbifer celer TaxID=435905 RepID=A0ABW3U9X3_9GAMM|nr:HlyD family efflux transporter periplasmic adaptor subunit [Microbulbifer celer]UFN56506.1 biotin/lipoyl-binding protein [Microbulbifer celer]